MTQHSSEPPFPQATSDDVASIDAIVNALYDVISGAVGAPRDWDRLRSLYIPGARLIPTSPTEAGGAMAMVHDVEGYIKRASDYFEKASFYEREIARRTELFGNIAHVFSTYESRHAKEDLQPFVRGINSIQLVNDGHRWWVVTVFWENERPDNHIPDEYLPQTNSSKQ